MLGVVLDTEPCRIILAYTGPPEVCPNPTPSHFGLELVGIVDRAVAAFKAQGAGENLRRKHLCSEVIVEELFQRGFRLVMDFEPGYWYAIDLDDQLLPWFSYQNARTDRDLDEGKPIELGHIGRAQEWFAAWTSDAATAAPDARADMPAPAVFAFRRSLHRAPNVFLLDGISEEDMFTSAWHYLLCKRPEVGQRVIDYLITQASLPPSRFHFAVNHPLADDRAGNYPDFLIKADPASILFEHKLTAELGDLQLERYLSTAEAMSTRLALVAVRPVAVPTEVLASPVYLKPKTRGKHHFFWQDFAELLATPAFADDDLVQDFVELMDRLGLRRGNWAGLGDPLMDPPATKAFRELLVDTARKLKDEAEFVRVAPRNPGIELRKPTPGVGLAYFLFGTRGRLVRGRVVLAQIGVDSPERLPWPGKSETRHVEVMPGVNASLYKGTGTARWNKELHFTRYYEIPLDLILNCSPEEAVETMCSVVRGVLQHVRQEVEPNAAPKRPRKRATSARVR